MLKALNKSDRHLWFAIIFLQFNGE